MAFILGQEKIESERSYIESLERVTKEYKEPLMVTYGLKGTKVGIVMKKIEEIARHHKMFQIELADKVKKWDEKEEIGGIFAASNTEAKYPDRLSIFGLMDLLKYTPQNHHDRCNLQRALTDLENVTYRLNERKREKEQNFQAVHLMKSLNFRTVMDQTPRLLRQDDLHQSESVNGQVKTKTRRIYLLDKTLIGVTVLQREQDGRTVERLKPKMTVCISDLELKESAITPEMKSIIKSDNSKFSIQSKLIVKEFLCYSTTLPRINRRGFISFKHRSKSHAHDYTYLVRYNSLLASLKCSYQ
ncbi:hypothetical protein KUTeg_017373, partial [Tegillarca granosa]